MQKPSDFNPLQFQIPENRAGMNSQESFGTNSFEHNTFNIQQSFLSSRSNSFKVLIDPGMQKPSDFNPHTWFTSALPTPATTSGGKKDLQTQIMQNITSSQLFKENWLQGQKNFSIMKDALDIFQKWTGTGPEGNIISFVTNASLTLQSFLILSENQPGIPYVASEISKCFQQILWSPNDAATGLFCSRLTASNRQNLRETLLMVARGEHQVTKNQFNQVMAFIMSSINSTVTAVDFMRPITVGVINTILSQIWDTIKAQKEASKEDQMQVSSWDLINSIFTSLSSQEGKQLIADLLTRIQGENIFDFLS
jgi:hypothetical protein